MQNRHSSQVHMNIYKDRPHSGRLSITSLKEQWLYKVYSQSRIKLENSNRKVNGKAPDIWKL